MAFGISRRCFGVLYAQSSPGLTLAGPSRIGPCNLAIRGYAATAMKQKQKKASNRKNTELKLASKTNATPEASRTTTSSRASDLERPTHSATAARNQRNNQAAGGMSYKVPEEKAGPMTEEEQMEQVEQIMAMSKLFPTADPWGQRVDTLGGSALLSSYL